VLAQVGTGCTSQPVAIECRGCHASMLAQRKKDARLVDTGKIRIT